MDDIRIRISGDPSALDPTIKKLEQLGQVDKKNADGFSKHHEQFKKETKEKEGLIDRLESGTERKMERIAEYVAAAFATEKVFEWAKEAIHAFEEAEKATYQLKFAVEQLNKEGDKAFGRLVEQSEELSDNLNNMFTPKQIQTADAMLARIGLTADQIKKLNPVMVNMALNTGKSLEEVATSLDQAFSTGRTTSLAKNFGIFMKGTGDQIKDVNNFLQSTKSYASASAEALSLEASKAQQAAGKTEILAETVGKKLAPVFEDLKQEALGFTDILFSKRWYLAFSQGGIAVAEAMAKAEKETEKLQKRLADPIPISEWKKEHQKISDKELDLTKLTKKQLEERLEATKDSDMLLINEQNKTQGVIQKFNERGFEKEGQRIEKELKAREEAAKKKAELAEKEWERQLRILDKAFAEAERKYKKDTEEFIKHEKEKFDAANKAAEDNISLIIDNDILEASMTKSKIDDENAEYQRRINDFEIQFDEKGKITEASHKHLELLEKEHQKKLTDITDEESKKRNEKILEDAQVIVEAAGKLIQDYFEEQQKNIEHQETVIQKSIDIQAKLAEAGRANTLAQDQAMMAKLEKQRMLDQKKMIKAKELETFLNSVAEFSKTDPKTAVLKAIAQLALVKGAEALYMEKGGIAGMDGEKSHLGLLGFSRRHPSGKDILVHAEQGEGFFSKKEVNAMGGPKGFFAFKNALADPMREVPIPMNGMLFQGMNTKGIEQRLDSLENTVKNKKETSVDFEGLYMWIIERERGVINATKLMPKTKL